MDKTKQLELKRIANNLRISIIEEVYNAKCGHPGGSLSIADIMTYLYFVEMNIDPADPRKVDRDTPPPHFMRLLRNVASSPRRI